MGQKYNWSKDKYRTALLGDKAEKVEGLRNLAHGFSASNGYNLNDFDNWTPYQKRKVREYFHKVEEFEAQPKMILRPRSKKNLDALQRGFHGKVLKGFKVAFMPYHDPVTTLPGAKKRKPKVKLIAGGEGVSVDTGSYHRRVILFNQKNLARDPRAEIKRVAEKIPGAALYFVAVGEEGNQTLSGKSLNFITSDILKWMAQYDGKKALPKGSGNRGDNPKYHHWKLWLNGLVGYVLPKRQDVRKLGRIISQGRKANDERKRKLKNMMRRKGRK